MYFIKKHIAACKFQIQCRLEKQEYFQDLHITRNDI